MEGILQRLQHQPLVQHPDCCAGLSMKLIHVLSVRLPKRPALTLSVGAGSGLLEELILRAAPDSIELFGVEVPSSTNRYLREGRMWRVRDAEAVHPDAVLADALLFVYPRSTNLLASYVETCRRGALHRVILITHRSHWTEGLGRFFSITFEAIDVMSSLESGLPDYEILVIASTTASTTTTTSSSSSTHAQLVTHH